VRSMPVHSQAKLGYLPAHQLGKGWLGSNVSTRPQAWTVK